METITRLNSFINSAIPYAWDDSESWFEFLAKVLNKVNELVESHNLFFSVSVAEYVEQTLNKWQETGELNEKLTEILSPLVQTTLQEKVNITTMGVTGNTLENESIKIIEAITFCNTNNKILYFPKGTYKIINPDQEELLIPGCSMQGEDKEKSVLKLDGAISFDTSELNSITVQNMTFLQENNFLTDTDYLNSKPHLFECNKIKKTVNYSNLIFKGVVPIEDGSQRYRGAISDAATDLSIIENIVFYNQATCLSIMSMYYPNNQPRPKNFTINNIVAFNFETCVWIAADNSTISNITGYNIGGTQDRIWIQKNHPTIPKPEFNGYDLLLCSGNKFTIYNLYAENPIERTIYSMASDVTAYSITSYNGDGIKFVGEGGDKYSKNISISNTTHFVTETRVMESTGITLYWVEDIKIYDSSLVWEAGTLPRDMINVSRHVKNLEINNCTINNCGLSFLCGVLKSEENLPGEEYVVLENCTIKNCSVTNKNQRSAGTIFNSYHNIASMQALENYAFKNISVIDCFCGYETNRDDMWYNFSFTNGFYATGNKANKRGHWAHGGLNGAHNITKNIVLKEKRIFSSDIGASISNLITNLKLSKGSVVEFETESSYPEIVIATITYNHSITTDDTFLPSGACAVTIEIQNAKQYGTLSYIPDNSIITLVDSIGNYFKAKRVAGVMTDIVGTFPASLLVTSGAGILIRGDQYLKNLTLKIKGFV